METDPPPLAPQRGGASCKPQPRKKRKKRKRKRAKNTKWNMENGKPIIK